MSQGEDAQNSLGVATESPRPAPESKWYVGTMNDAYFVIDKPPQPSPIDYFCSSDHHDVDVIMACGTDKRLADLLVSEHNARIAENRRIQSAVENLRRDVDQPFHVGYNRAIDDVLLAVDKHNEKSPEEISHSAARYKQMLRQATATPTCADCYEIGVIRNAESPKVVSLCAAHAGTTPPDWVACGMDEAFPRQVTLTFASEDDAYRYYVNLRLASDLGTFCVVCGRLSTTHCPICKTIVCFHCACPNWPFGLKVHP